VGGQSIADFLNLSRTDNQSTMRQRLTHLFALLTLTLSACGQSNSDSDTLGAKWARQQLKTALTDTTQHNVINSKFIILDSKDKAVKFAEQILFDSYGKKQIENEKPYEVHNIDNYWVINGTLPKGWKGGTFLIIINSHDCRVVKLTHGK
jgi:NTF2 fold immunity protein